MTQKLSEFAVDINAGAIDGTTVGASVPATGAFTTLSASGATTLAAVTASGAITASGGVNGTLGATTPATVAATTLTTTGAATFGDGITLTNASNARMVIKGGAGTNEGGGYFVQYAGTSNTLFAAGDSARFIGGTPDLRSMIFSDVPLDFYVNGATRMTLDASGNLLAGADNTQTLGGASNRWSVVYAGTGTINTSDAREKTAVSALTANEVEASKQLGKEIGTYKWLAAVAEKGDTARAHIGMTVQRAIEIMTANNLDPMVYGFICYDAWGDEFIDHPAIEAQEATEDAPAVEAVAAWTEQTNTAGDRYGFRYDELLAFIAAGFSARLEALEAV